MARLTSVRLAQRGAQAAAALPGGVRIALGGLWLLDGVLQLQPFMFGRGFVTQVLLPSAAGQPAPIAASIMWSAHLVARHLAVWNALFAGAQLTIGAGLLWRRTVRPALVASFVWAALMWWLGEGFGMLPAGTASPLTGAPGSALLYALVGALVWPIAATPAAGRRWATARAVWAALWCGATVLWLLPANRAANAVHDTLAAAADGEPRWLAQLFTGVAGAAAGHGAVIAVVFALASLVIGVGALGRRPAPFILAGAALAVCFWVTGQAFGAILTGQATDPNTGPLIALLAAALLTDHQLAARRSPMNILENAPAPTPPRVALDLPAVALGDPRLRRPADLGASPLTPGPRWGRTRPGDAFALAQALEPVVVLADGERFDDAVAATAAIVMARAACDGRGPTGADLDAAMSLLGYRRGAPHDLVAWRRRALDLIAGDPERLRRLVALPVHTLQMDAAAIRANLARWRELIPTWVAVDPDAHPCGTAPAAAPLPETQPVTAAVARPRRAEQRARAIQRPHARWRLLPRHGRVAS